MPKHYWRVVRTPNGDRYVRRVTKHRAVLDRRPKPVTEAAHKRAERDTNFWGATAKSKHESRSNAIRVARRGLGRVDDWPEAKPPRSHILTGQPTSIITDTQLRKLQVKGWKIK